jgi:hypothetical protein
MLKNILKYIILTALRDWFFVALIIGMIGIFGVSMLFGFTALNEQAEMQLVVFAGAIRLLLVCGISTFVSFYMARSFENREVTFILAKNISREKFIFAYWCGFNLLVLILLALLGTLMLLFFRNANLWGTLQWFGSIGFELAIMVSFCISLSLIVGSPVFSVLSSFGFYILARLMGFFASLPSLNPGSSRIAGALLGISNKLFVCISSLIPRFDLFGQTKWLVYGGDSKLALIILLQSLIYIPLLFTVAFYDFRKKEF